MWTTDPEEINKMFEEQQESYRRNSQWLRDRGWKESGGNWFRPEKPQGIMSFVNAFTDEMKKELRETGWKEISVSDYNPRLDKARGVKKYGGLHNPWAFFIHPESKKIYSYLEAISICYERNNDDTDVMQYCSQLTQALNDLVKGGSINQPSCILLTVTFENGLPTYTLDGIAEGIRGDNPKHEANKTFKWHE